MEKCAFDFLKREGTIVINFPLQKSEQFPNVGISALVFEIKFSVFSLLFELYNCVCTFGSLKFKPDFINL